MTELNKATEAKQVDNATTYRDDGEKKADFNQNNLFTSEKFAVYIPDPWDIQGTWSIALDKDCTDWISVPNFRKINFCNSQYMLFYYVLLFQLGIQY